ncbi:DUF4446 family protein [Clostridium cylindrosporum]|uniref:DUF4446 domain-containing protein n=1 Tax=Clostridium cylindrosporum DSM 605 TaxID=1121307 RepID=A0A0J8DBU0_CLOCY|nr:DUF4446 family protein [Clostridium cylindrosporum]KMT21758.1 hypothetical protein CLCY_3c00250 [Clostridium cylindrosporum DSM 605]
MEMILETISEYNTLIIIAILALILVLIVIQIVNKVHLNKLDKKYRKLFRNSKSETIEDMIIDYGSRVEKILEYTRNVHKAYKGIDERISGCTQKVGMIRYKAFDDIGSDLSYSIALLDESDSGVVITGIYGRNDSTTFAKPIDNGISKYDLSDEEKEAIDRAQKAYKDNNKYRMDTLEEISDLKEYRPLNNESDEDEDDYEGDYSDDENYQDEYSDEDYDDYDETAYDEDDEEYINKKN